MPSDFERSFPTLTEFVKGTGRVLGLILLVIVCRVVGCGVIEALSSRPWW